MLLALGVKKGPVVRQVLMELFDVWRKSDYKATKDELLKHVGQIPVKNTNRSLSPNLDDAKKLKN